MRSASLPRESEVKFLEGALQRLDVGFAGQRGSGDTVNVAALGLQRLLLQQRDSLLVDELRAEVLRVGISLFRCMSTPYGLSRETFDVVHLLTAGPDVRHHAKTTVLFDAVTAPAPAPPCRDWPRPGCPNR